MSAVDTINTLQFSDKVLHAAKPVVVDFYASWCPPCRMIAPLLDELAVEFADRVAFYKVDVDQEYSLAQKYAISGVPTLVLFRSGREVDRIVGALGPDRLRRRIEQLASSCQPDQAVESQYKSG